MTGKKPWNRANLPVCSISSKADGAANMHIITYASQICMQPKRFICGIYHTAKTLQSVEASGEFVFQLLEAAKYRL
jgi:flavin reductase (DIM6/NTAB) family NADH-FMN oxidoreductase RutF